MFFYLLCISCFCLWQFSGTASISKNSLSTNQSTRPNTHSRTCDSPISSNHPGIASISKTSLSTNQSTRLNTHSRTCDSPISCPHRSADCFIGGTPDSDVTVPLPARYVVDQARSIRLQISTPLHQCSQSVLANQILIDEIDRLEEQCRLMIDRRQITLVQEDINLLRAELIRD
jgi:hypothetical protein